MLRFEVAIHEKTPIPVDVIRIITGYMLEDVPKKDKLLRELVDRFDYFCDECQSSHHEFAGTLKHPPMIYCCPQQSPWYNRCSFPFVRAQASRLGNKLIDIRRELWPMKERLWEPRAPLGFVPHSENKKQLWNEANQLRQMLINADGTWWGGMFAVLQRLSPRRHN